MIVLRFFNGRSIRAVIVEHCYDLDLSHSRSVVCKDHFALNGRDWELVKGSLGNLQAQLSILDGCLDVDLLEFLLQTSKYPLDVTNNV